VEKEKAKKSFLPAETTPTQRTSTKEKLLDLKLACVASVSVGLSASLKLFCVFERAKNASNGRKTYGNAC